MAHLDSAALGPDRPCTVLCIEDDPVSMALVEGIVSSFAGVRLIKAWNGREGVQATQAERPELVLLDMHLPDIGGLEVIRALSPVLAERQLRVVLLTADSFSIDVVKAMSLGASEYWPKPLTFDRASTALRRVLGHRVA